MDNLTIFSDKIPQHVEGPKLPPFRGNIENIEFLKVLGQSGSSSEAISHSRVFKVRIDGELYALKVFNFFSLDDLWLWVSCGEDMLTDDLVRYHLDPFYAECRAFGRLVEKNKDDALAVRCHGYAFLPQAIEYQIQAQFGFDDWNRQPEGERIPLRAIVKDYIHSESVCGWKDLSMMRSNLQKLNRMGIFNMNIGENSYRGGQLYDFSTAITSPHIWLSTDLRSSEQISQDCGDDLESFDWMANVIENQKSVNAGSVVERRRKYFDRTSRHR